jgi:RNA polymerase sigma-70 factor, ECF subfamily
MRIQKLDDSVLIAQYIAGQEKPLEVLITRHKQRVYSFIYSKILDKELSEDIFQDTFIKVINTLKKGAYNEEGKFLPWVLRIAHNLVIDFFRKNKRMPLFKNTDDFDIFSVLADSKIDIESELIREQIYSDVFKLLSALPNDQREVLEMRLYKDMSFKEIALQTDVSINTALGRMRYALINLRRIISEKEIILTN